MEKVIIGKYTFNNIQHLINILDINISEMRDLFLGKTLTRDNNITLRLQNPKRCSQAFSLIKNGIGITLIEEELR